MLSIMTVSVLYSNVIGVKFFTEVLENAQHIFELEVSERVDKEVLEEFRARLTVNKPKKGKGKGGKKGSKKKKK
jgi:hypothetical protein